LFIKALLKPGVFMAVLLLIAIAIGCGGSDGEITVVSQGKPRKIYDVKAVTTVTTGALSREEFFDRASRMCRNRQALVNHRLELFREEAGPGAHQRRVLEGAAYTWLLPGIQFIFDDLRLMGSPEGDERQIEEMVGAFQSGVETGQSGKVSSAREFVRLFRDYNRFARAYGLDQCTIERSHYEPIWEMSRAASLEKQN
jgi:hypothetical protein